MWDFVSHYQKYCSGWISPFKAAALHVFGVVRCRENRVTPAIFRMHPWEYPWWGQCPCSVSSSLLFPVGTRGKTSDAPQFPCKRSDSRGCPCVTGYCSTKHPRFGRKAVRHKPVAWEAGAAALETPKRACLGVCARLFQEPCCLPDNITSLWRPVLGTAFLSLQSPAPWYTAGTQSTWVCFSTSHHWCVTSSAPCQREIACIWSHVLHLSIQQPRVSHICFG